ncbi:MAG: PDZ domain-containing protein [Calditrichia bacterium]
MKLRSVYSILIMLFLFTLGLSATSTYGGKKVVFRSDDEAALGVAIENVKPEILKKYDLKGGAEIVGVIDGSEADKIGLKEDDIIVEFDGTKVTDARQLRNMVADLKKEKKVSLVVMRDGTRKAFEAQLKPIEPRDIRVDVDGKDLDLDLKSVPDVDVDIDLEGLKDLPEIITNRIGCGFSDKGGYLGVSVENLNDQLKKYFDVSQGVLIKKVTKESPAEKAGLEAGDIILKVGDRIVEDYSDLVRFIDYYNPGDKVRIEYSRKGKVSKAEVTLGKKENFMWHGGDHDFIFKGGKDLNRKIKIQMDKIRDLGDKLKDLKINIDMYII